jgi:hypothetical protein
LARLAQNQAAEPRQCYVPGGNFALIRHQHAEQFERANRALKTLLTYLGWVTRDIGRKISADARLKTIFAQPPTQALTRGYPGGGLNSTL